MTREDFEQDARNDPHGAIMKLFDRQEAIEHTVADFADVIAADQAQEEPEEPAQAPEQEQQQDQAA